MSVDAVSVSDKALRQSRMGIQIKNYLRIFGLPSILVLLFITFSIVSEYFLTAANIEGLILSAAISCLMFLGLTWVFTIGEMDVSFVAIAALANMITAGLVIAGYGWPIATALAMLASLSVGLLNGLLIAKLGLPSLVITIATGGMASALAAAIGLGSSMGIDQVGYLEVLFDTKVGIVSFVVILTAILIAACWYIQEKLTLGHYIFSMATNPIAVLEAGVSTSTITILLCVFASACSGAAGILLAVQLASGQPSIAQSLFLDGLTAVLLGGTMLRLGKPNIIGTIIAVLIITVLVRGGALLGWSDAGFSTIKGLLLLFGVAVVVWSNQEQRRTS